jgi:hypothetical protein
MFPHLDKAEIIESSKIQTVRNIFKPSGQLGEKQIFVREMTINAKAREDNLTFGEDVAFIRAQEDTHVQRYEGEGTVTEIMLDCFVIDSEREETADQKYVPRQRAPIGVILMSPEGQISTYIYDPRTDGGPRKYSVTKNWRMQTIILPGTELQFYDHWSPKGFNNPGVEKRYYGFEVLPDEEDVLILKKFKDARKELMNHLKEIS